MPADAPPGWYTLSLAHDHLGVGELLTDDHDVVLMYHSVGRNGDVSRESFRSHLEFLTRTYEVVDLPGIRPGDDSEKRVALTFDDGTRDFYRTVAPLLEEYGVPATVFLIGEALADESFQQDDERDYEYMTVEEVRELLEYDTVHVGNHTLTHRPLPELSVAEQSREIRGGKRRLEEYFDCEIDRFCYPYNAHDRSAVEIVAETHEVAVTSGGRKRVIDERTNRMLVPRLEASDDPTELRWDVHDASTAVWRPAAALFHRVNGIAGQ